MNRPDLIKLKIKTATELQWQIAQWRVHGKTVAFTNGVFDILHVGHLESLSAAAREAQYLIVAVNTDESVKKLKGKDRPVNTENDRAALIASISLVDAVVLFNEDTPYELIKQLLPDVLVKGGDYTLDQVVGSKEIMANGGRVVINPILPGYSTTGIIAKSKLI